jgi:hypothetical protein
MGNSKPCVFEISRFDIADLEAARAQHEQALSSIILWIQSCAPRKTARARERIDHAQQKLERVAPSRSLNELSVTLALDQQLR